MSKDFKIGFNARGVKISAAKVESEYNIFGGLYRQKTNMAWVLAHISVFSKNCPSCNENTGCKAFVSWSKTECANLEQRGGEVPIFKIEESKMHEFFPYGHLQLNLCDVREHFVEINTLVRGIELKQIADDERIAKHQDSLRKYFQSKNKSNKKNTVSSDSSNNSNNSTDLDDSSNSSNSSESSNSTKSSESESESESESDSSDSSVEIVAVYNTKKRSSETILTGEPVAKINTPPHTRKPFNFENNISNLSPKNTLVKNILDKNLKNSSVSKVQTVGDNLNSTNSNYFSDLQIDNSISNSWAKSLFSAIELLENNNSSSTTNSTANSNTVVDSAVNTSFNTNSKPESKSLDQSHIETEEFKFLSRILSYKIMGEIVNNSIEKTNSELGNHVLRPQIEINLGDKIYSKILLKNVSESIKNFNNIYHNKLVPEYENYIKSPDIDYNSSKYRAVQISKNASDKLISCFK